VASKPTLPLRGWDAHFFDERNLFAERECNVGKATSIKHSKKKAPSSNGAKAPRPEGALRRGVGVHIAPSLLAADFADLRGAMRSLKAASIRWLHLDVMDGHFVQNLTMGVPVLKSIAADSPDFYFDVHLMIDQPRAFVRPFADAGAKLITFHVEAAGDDSVNLLKHIRRIGVHSGISVRPKTPISAIRDCLPYADLVLIMTVEPGFGGQKLMPETLNKVRELVHLRDELGLSFLIQVDGGINLDTGPLAVAAGADVLVAGTSVFHENRIRQNVSSLRKSLSNIR
jgi:ribulose-phosphate 3-epimerase